MAGDRPLVQAGALSDSLIDGRIITKKFEHLNPDANPCPAEAPSAIHFEAFTTGLTKTQASQPPSAGFDGFTKQIDIFLSTPAPDEQTMKQMAKLFMQTCPGDWELPWNYGVRHALRTVRDGTGEPAHPDIDIAAIMKFRLEAAQLADAIVDVAHLKQPAGQICIMWDFHKWREDAKKRFPNFDTRKGFVNNTLRDAGVVAKPLLTQGGPFYRFSDYLTASILEMGAAQEETRELCSLVITVFNKTLERVGQRALDQAKRHNEGPTWYASVRKTRTSTPRRSAGSSSSFRGLTGQSPEESPSRGAQRRLESRREASKAKGR